MPFWEATRFEWLAPTFVEVGAERRKSLRVYKGLGDDAGMLAMLIEVAPPVVGFHFGCPPQSGDGTWRPR